MMWQRKQLSFLTIIQSILVACLSREEVHPPLGAGGSESPPSVEPVAGTPPVICDEQTIIPSIKLAVGAEHVDEQQCGPYVPGNARCFRFEIQQPVDHVRGRGFGTFAQSVRLIHRGCAQPVTVSDSGYAFPAQFYELEPSTAFETNTLMVEHRFQGTSRPGANSWDWGALSIENAAADLHLAIERLRRMYVNRWISTGASKGGITALYHRYLYPRDVEGTISYVAPASIAREDWRYQEQMESPSRPRDCIEKVRAVQTRALGRLRPIFEDMLLREFAEAAADAPWILELLAATYEWNFWQADARCPSVPKVDDSDAVQTSYFRGYMQRQLAELNRNPTRDEDLADAALSLEWAWQQGYARQFGTHIPPLLRTSVLSDISNEQVWRQIVPDYPLPEFDGRLTLAAVDWVRSQAQNVVLVYGQYDPWSGGALDELRQPSSGRFIAPAVSHRARIADLAPAERMRAMKLTSEMYGLAMRMDSQTSLARDSHLRLLEAEANRTQAMFARYAAAAGKQRQVSTPLRPANARVP